MRGAIAVGLGLLLAGLLKAAPPPPVDSSDEALARARFAAGKFAEAEQLFSRALASAHPKPSLHYNRAVARFNQQNYLGAKQDLDAHLILAPSSPDALALRAEIGLLLGRPADALGDVEAALESQPEDLNLSILRARARLELGRPEAARGDLERVLARVPSHARALIARGDVSLALGEWNAAEADYLRASELNPPEPEASFKLGLARFRRLEFTGAIAALKRAAELAPSGPLIFRTLGSAHYGAGDFAGAEQALRRSVDLDAGPATYARILLGVVQRRMGKSTPPPSGQKLPPSDELSWPELLTRFHRRELSEDDLLLAARNLTPADARAGRWCEALFYTGTEHLLAGDHLAARHCFEEATATGQTEFVEYTLARAELARLPRATPAPLPKRPRR